MNPTEQSGENVCEQPALSWVDYRNLAGLSLIALVLFIAGGMTFNTETNPTPAAVVEAVLPVEEGAPQEGVLEFIDVLEPALEELPTPEIQSVN